MSTLMPANHVTIALASKGALNQPTLEFLKSCDLKVSHSNPRQYIASIPMIAGLDVLFQRVTDIVYKVIDGTVDLGITGLDVVYEYGQYSEDLVVLHDNLRFGDCSLVVAVPESWVDVDSMIDLADVALEMRENHHRNLRVATKFSQLTRRFLHQHGVHHFTLVSAEGAIEAAPMLGYADIIVDITATGTTLRENQLKPIPDGTVLESRACLIGNLRRLRENPEALNTARSILEMIDGALGGQRYYQLTGNIRGQSAAQVAHDVASHPVTKGLQGPTVAPIYAANTPEQDDGQWFSVTVIVPSKALLPAITHLREIGGTHTSAIPVRYAFMPQSPSYEKLLERLQASPSSQK